MTSYRQTGNAEEDVQEIPRSTYRKQREGRSMTSYRQIGNTEEDVS